MLNFIAQAIFGLIVGVIAKVLMPGKDPGGLIVTAIIGAVGAVIGSFVGQNIFGSANYQAGWIMSIVGAMMLLFLYRALTKT